MCIGIYIYIYTHTHVCYVLCYAYIERYMDIVIVNTNNLVRNMIIARASQELCIVLRCFRRSFVEIRTHVQIMSRQIP